MIYITKRAFTLVELIVVITILAVLATVGFISMTGYSQNSRDSVRLSDIKSITKTFEIQKTKDVKLPLPEYKIDIIADGNIIQYQ
jgi:prepilin-type N-terminal cleavage/methylation domain-containing protein